jgi:hypothetical protein
LRVLVVFELTPLLNPRKLRPIFSRVGLHGCQSPRRLTRTVRKKVRAYHIRRHARARNGRWAMSARGEADAVRSRSSFLAAAEPLARGDWMSASCPHQAAFVATMRRSSRGRRATGGSDERDGVKGAGRSVRRPSKPERLPRTTRPRTGTLVDDLPPDVGGIPDGANSPTLRIRAVVRPGRRRRYGRSQKRLTPDIVEAHRSLSNLALFLKLAPKPVRLRITYARWDRCAALDSRCLPPDRHQTDSLVGASPRGFAAGSR